MSREIVFIRNGLTGGGLGIMSALQANYFYEQGFNVTVIVDQSYNEKIVKSENYKMYNPGINIIFALTSPKYKSTSPQVSRKSIKKEWFGGTISYYYDEYGVLVKKSYHDSNGQRVKVEIPIMDEYLKSLKSGDIVTTFEASLIWHVGDLELPEGVSTVAQIHNQHFYLSDWIDNIDNYTKLVCFTEKTKEAYEKLYGKKNNIEVIPNPLRHEFPNEIMSHKNRPLKIVSVGRLEEGKQVEHTIEVFSEIAKKNQNAYLEIYGKGKEEEKLRKLVKELNLENKVYFKGHEKDLNKIFKDAALMIFASKRESFGLVIIEALSFGVPVIAYSTVFGVDDLIQNGVNGYIVPQGDKKSLYEKSIELLEDVNTREKFGKNGYEFAKNFIYDKVMKQWLDLMMNLSNIKSTELLYNKIKRMDLPKQLVKKVYNQQMNEDDLKKFISYLKEAKAKIVNGKAYIYSEELLNKFPIFKLEDYEIK